MKAVNKVKYTSENKATSKNYVHLTISYPKYLILRSMCIKKLNTKSNILKVI